jgi:polyhydroxybutyrate depolymerase
VHSARPSPLRAALVTLGLLALSCAGAAPSGGCGAAPPEHLTSLTVGGETRTFLLNVPEPYDPDTPHALVLAFHGRTSPASEVRGYYDLEPHAAETLGPTIFVYPEALTQDDGTFSWWNPGDAATELRDFALFDALVGALGEAYCLDYEQLYAVGHSLGGSFVNALGCHRAEVLRALASLGAGPGGGPCAGEVAAMVLHHPDDELVAFDYGLAARDQFLAQNGLEGPPRPSAPRSLNCQRYGLSENPNPVLWCPHTQSYTRSGRLYTHNWPAETGAAVMRFFAALP